jgi:calcineurin-like phosphoesterase family protein
MLDAFSNWASKMEQMSEVDKAIIREMQTTYRSGRDIVEFIGKLMVAANAANIGKKIIAPLNVSQINEVIQGILRSKEQIFLPNNKVSVWEFYNTLTNVLKGNKSDIVTLLADTNNISNMTADALLNK